MRLRLVIVLAASAASLVGCAQASQPAPKTDEEKTLYAMGMMLAQNIKPFDLTPKELEMLKAGMTDSLQDKASIKREELEGYLPKVQELNTKRMEAATKREKETGTAFIAKAATEAGAKKTASGLVFKSVKEGTGPAPKDSDVVKVNYEGKFTDGKVFDSSTGKEPATFPLNGVIPCWSEGVQLMKVGGKAHIVCPPELAYGDEGRPPQMRGGATLVFEVELLAIVDPAVEAAAAQAAAAAAAPPPPAPAPAPKKAAEPKKK